MISTSDEKADVAITPQPIGDYEFRSLYFFFGDNDHMLGLFDDGVSRIYGRVDITSGESTLIGEDGHENTSMGAFGDDRLLAIYTDATSREVVIEDPLGGGPQEPITTVTDLDITVGTLSNRHVFYGADGIGYEVKGREDDGTWRTAQVIQSNEAGSVCATYGPKPSDRIAFSLMEGGFAIVDYSEPMAFRAGTVLPQHGGRVNCPHWNTAGTAFAYVERIIEGDEHSYVYVVYVRDEGDLSEPELVIDRAGDLAVRIAQP